MRLLPLLVSLCVFSGGWGCGWGDCMDPEVVPLPAGSYPSRPEVNYGTPEHGLPHAGAVERMEVDREAGLVRLHGRTDAGVEFVETFRIVESIVD